MLRATRASERLRAVMLVWAVAAAAGAFAADAPAPAAGQKAAAPATPEIDAPAWTSVTGSPALGNG